MSDREVLKMNDDFTLQVNTEVFNELLNLFLDDEDILTNLMIDEEVRLENIEFSR